jgi:hypothetical protein
MTISDIAPYLLIALIVVINLALWASLSSKSTRSQFDLWHKATMSLQKPWEKENKDFQELNERVKALQHTGNESVDAHKDDA